MMEEAKAAGVKPVPRPNAVATPACDAMKASGQWNAAWDLLAALDPVWFDEYMATGIAIYKSSPLPPKELELLSIAVDASFTHMFAPGTHRHIQRAFKAGATLEEIMEVLKLCVVQGVQACNLGVPILADELAKASRKS
jgi:alkylhydroperoxidase/carboxymuconolactone decarboxylase family protein YurZ